MNEKEAAGGGEEEEPSSVVAPTLFLEHRIKRNLTRHLLQVFPLLMGK
jgi:hypothetical protein